MIVTEKKGKIQASSALHEMTQKKLAGVLVEVSYP